MSTHPHAAAPLEPAATAPARRALTGLALAMVFLDLVHLGGLALGGHDTRSGTILVATAKALTPSVLAAFALVALAWAALTRSRPAVVGGVLILLAYAARFVPPMALSDAAADDLGAVRFVVTIAGLVAAGVAVGPRRASALVIGLLLASIPVVGFALAGGPAPFIVALLAFDLALVAVLAAPLRSRHGAVAPSPAGPADDVALRAATRGARLLRLGFIGLVLIHVVPGLLDAVGLGQSGVTVVVTLGLLATSLALGLTGVAPFRRLPARSGARVLAWATTALMAGTAVTFIAVLVGKMFEPSWHTALASLASLLAQAAAVVFTYLAHVATSWLGRRGLSTHVRAALTAPVVVFGASLLTPLALHRALESTPLLASVLNLVAALPYLIAALAAGRLARALDAAALVTPFGDAPAPPAPSTLEPTPS
ncbi:MAG: hypothetical protein H6745_22600 [Deltaproteobacteria bacterium]|nr:hypothetical protein [Deltaproteobacteria bacterium]